MSCLSFLAPRGQIAALSRDTVALSHKEHSTPKIAPKPQETVDPQYESARGKARSASRGRIYIKARSARPYRTSWHVGVVRTVSGWSAASAGTVTV